MLWVSGVEAMHNAFGQEVILKLVFAFLDFSFAIDKKNNCCCGGVSGISSIITS